MLHVIPILVATSASLDILKKAKNWFYPDKTLGEAESLLKKCIAGNVESLQEQLKAHRQVIDKLVEQVKADKDMIEKHNEILIQLSEAAQQTLLEVRKMRIVSFCAIGLASLSLLGAVVLWVYL